jgi:hypothetical protein
MLFSFVYNFRQKHVSFQQIFRQLSTNNFPDGLRNPCSASYEPKASDIIVRFSPELQYVSKCW